MTNPTIEIVKSSTSFRKRITINRQLFEIVMTKAESLVNRICGENELIYFCSEDHSDDEIRLVLNVMGFDESRLRQACKELYGLFQQLADDFNDFCILQDLDDVTDTQDCQAAMEARGNCLSLISILDTSSLLPSPQSLRVCGQLSPRADDLRHSGDAEKVCTPHGIQINVFHGDLVKQQTEAIVVITNSKLQCSTWPGKAVLAAIGGRHPDDCSSFLKAQGQLKPCQVMHTDAGNLWPNVFNIIHAIQPRSEDLNEPQKQHSLLEDLCFNCLQYANTKLKAKSISTPFVLTDLSTVRYPVVASAICKAVLKFDQYISDGADGSTLKQINVVCSDRETVIVQMKTFDVFLPKLIHTGLRSLESPDKLPLTDEILHNGSILVKIEVEEDLWWKERINSYYDQLQLNISLDGGLEGELMKHDVFPPSTLHYSMEEQSTPKKNKHLLNSLLQGDEVMFRNFCEALTLSGQDHIVARYLSEKSPYAPRRSIPRSISEPTLSADLKLLQPWKFKNLSKFQNELIEQIISDCGLVSRLRSLQVFTEHQLAELEAEKHETSRNRLMLQWLARSSEGAHDRFCEALRLNKQAHLVTNYLNAFSHSLVRSEKSVSFRTDLLNSDKSRVPRSGYLDQPDFK